MHFLLPAAFGALAVGGFAPFGFYILPFFSIALLWYCLGRCTPLRAAIIGFAWGLGYFVTGISWVYVGLAGYADIPLWLSALATFALCMLMAIYPAVACTLWVAFKPPSGLASAFAGAGIWTLTEWLRGWIGSGFPWLQIGYSQTPPSLLAGYAPIFGVLGVGFFVVLLSLLPFYLSVKRVFLAYFLILSTGYGLNQIQFTSRFGNPIQVSLLQGNIPQNEKWDNRSIDRALVAFAELAKAHPANILVMPETSLPLFYENIPPEFLKDITSHGTTLLGSAERRDPPAYTNSVIAIMRSATSYNGVHVLGRYAKRHLVPFGEYPLPGFGWFLRLSHLPMTNFTPGPTTQSLMIIGNQSVAVNICYEDIFGEEIIDMLPAATLLINVSNTAWFGQSLAQPQHLQIARMRAMETGRMMLRAGNSGITAVIDQKGMVLDQLPPFTRAALRINAQGYQGSTPYVRFGNTPAIVLALIACMCGFWPRGYLRWPVIRRS